MRLVQESPIGTLTCDEIIQLREAYQRGAELVALEQQMQTRESSSSSSLERSNSSRSSSSSSNNNHHNINSHKNTPERQWQSSQPLGRKRLSRQSRQPRESLVLDWPYLTDLVLEGWIILDRLTAELEHHHKQQQQQHLPNGTAWNTTWGSLFKNVRWNRQQDQERQQIVDKDDESVDTTTTTDPTSISSSSSSSSSSSIGVLMPWPLQTWRLIHLYEVPLGGPCQQRLPTVQQVYPRVANCLDQELFKWSSHLVNFHLDVISSTTTTVVGHYNSQQATALAQRVFDTLVLRESNNMTATATTTLGFNNNQNNNTVVVAVDDDNNNNAAHPHSQPITKQRRRRRRKPRYPDRDLISKMIFLWHKSGHAESAQRALQLLQLLIEVHELFPDVDKFTPDAFVYAAVIQCLASTGKANDHHQPPSRSAAARNDKNGSFGWALHPPNQHHHASPQDDDNNNNGAMRKQQQAEVAAMAGPLAFHLLSEGRTKYNVQLSKRLYNTILKCLTLSYDPKCQKQALDLFRERVGAWRRARTALHAKDGQPKGLRLRNINEYVGKMERCEPNSYSYMPLVQSLVRSGQVHQAMSLLHSMEHVARETNEQSVAPPDDCYRLIKSVLDRKTQAHGRNHARYPFLRWTSAAPSTRPCQTHTLWEQEAWQTCMQIRADLQTTLAMTTTGGGGGGGVTNDPSVSVRDAFALFDKVTEQSFRYGSEVAPNFFPWPNYILDQAIGAWKQMRYIQRSNKKTRHAAAAIWGPEYRAPLADPRWLLNRLNNYCAVGLFRPCGESLEYMLDLVVMSAGKGSDQNAAILSLALMEFLFERCGDPQHDVCFPDRKPFRRLVQIWRKSAAATATENAAAYHQQQQHEMIMEEGKNILRGIISARQLGTENEIDIMEGILQQLRFCYLETNKMDKFRPDANMYANLVETWSDLMGPINPKRVAKRASDLLRVWKALTATGAGTPAAAERDENNSTRTRTTATDETEEHFVEDERDILKLYEAVVRAHSAVVLPPQSEPATTINETESLMVDILRICREGKHPTFLACAADALLFPLVESLEQSGAEPRLVQQAIDQLYQISHELRDGRFRPTTRCYNALIRAHGAAGELDKVEEVLQQMATPQRTRGAQRQEGSSSAAAAENDHQEIIYADLDTLNSVLHAWALSGSAEAPARAMEIWRLLDSSTLPLEPSLRTCNLMLQCFLNASPTGGGAAGATEMSRASVLEEARALVQRMETDMTAPPRKPNRDTYLHLMTFLKNCLLPDEALGVLKRFCELCENGTIHDGPDVRHFNLVIEAYAAAAAATCAQRQEQQQQEGMDNFDLVQLFDRTGEVFEMMSDASYIFSRISSDQPPFFAEPNEETYRGLLKVALSSSHQGPPSEEQLTLTETVVERIVRQRWHEKPENTQIALEIFYEVLDYWKSTSASSDDNNNNNDASSKRVATLEELIQTVEDEFENRQDQQRKTFF